MSEPAPETKRILCNNCREFTRHHLRARHTRICQQVFDDEGQSWFIAAGRHGMRPERDVERFTGSDYNATESPLEVRTSIWSCAGCDEETFEQEFLVAGEIEDDRGRIYYPERCGGAIQPKQFRKLSAKLAQVYSEVVSCFNRGSLLLCTLGLRALLEGICRDKGLEEKNLEKKIDGLIRFLPSVNLIEALHSFRFAGNAAAHDLDALSREDAARVIEIVEDLLNFLYELDDKASQVRTAASKGQAKSGLVH